MADDEDENTYHPSPDDALEPPDDIYNPEVDEEKLEEDYDTPAASAKPHRTTPKLPPNHPETDTEIDFQELYDEGLTSATDHDAQEEGPQEDGSWPLEPEEGYDDESGNR